VTRQGEYRFEYSKQSFEPPLLWQFPRTKLEQPLMFCKLQFCNLVYLRCTSRDQKLFCSELCILQADINLRLATAFTAAGAAPRQHKGRTAAAGAADWSPQAGLAGSRSRSMLA
jgi:hypothetical protein